MGSNETSQTDDLGPYSLIDLGNGHYAKVDPEYLHILSQFKWRAVQARWGIYAKATITRKGKKVTLSMHRFVAKTPFGQITHHKNRDTLDNRRANLANQDKRGHSMLHHTDNLKIRRRHPQ